MFYNLLIILIIIIIIIFIIEIISNDDFLLSNKIQIKYNKKIKIMSVNLCCWSINDNTLKNRMDKFKELINKYKPDVICLQEVFQFFIFNRFLSGFFYYNKELLKEYNINYCRHFKLVFNSGLLIMSKYKIIEHKCHKLYSYGMINNIREFCLQSIKINVNKSIISIFNTHLIAPEGSMCTDNDLIKIKNLQIDKIKTIINKQKNWILLGDMNTDLDLFKEESKKNKINKFIPNEKTVHSLKPLYTQHFYDTKVDHIYSDLKFTDTTIIKDIIVSDHYPILTTLNFF